MKKSYTIDVTWRHFDIKHHAIMFLGTQLGFWGETFGGIATANCNCGMGSKMEKIEDEIQRFQH